MKKAVLCLCFILSFVWLGSRALADDSANSSTHLTVDDGTADSDTGGSGANVNMNALAIDDQNVYDGMDKAYQNGYEPYVSQGTATIVLPVYVAADSTVTSVRAVPELGSTVGSPFVYKNYQKTVTLTEEKINGTDDKKPVFLVRFDLPLQAERYNGVYPVQLVLSYKNGGTACTQSFTSYIRITDGKSTEPETQPEVIPEETDPTAEPKVILAKSEQSPGQITSGSEFTLKAVLKNTNKLKYVQNITVTVNCDSPEITLLADSNVFYYDYLGTGETLEMALRFKSGEQTDEGKYTVTLDISYDNPQAMSMASSGKLEFQLYQEMRMQLEAGELMSEINAGDSVTIPIQALNLGRGKVYNVRCSIDAPGLSVSKSLFLGNMDGGSAVSGDLVIFAGMINPEAEKEADRYGRSAGSLKLIYEDEAGNSYTIEKNIVTEIKPLVVSSGETVEKKDEGIGLQLWIGIGIVLLILGLGTVIPFILRRRQMRNQYEDQGKL